MIASARISRAAGLLVVAGVAVVVSLAGCGKSDNPTVGGAAGSVCTPSGTQLSISAVELKYDKRCLAAPAGQDFTIVFDNREPLPHNVAIFRESASSDVFTGDIVTGPKVVTYSVKALPAGTYLFRCSVHPSQMVGTLLVR